MPHSETYQNGRRLPSVTEIIGKTKHKEFLVAAAAKLGTAKAQALEDAWRKWAEDKVIDRGRLYQLVPGSHIPDSWFTKMRISREDFWKTHTEVWGEKADIGKRFHDAIEIDLGAVLTGNDLGRVNALMLSEDICSMVASFQLWTAKKELVPLSLERKVTSAVFGYAGTYDAIVMLGDRGPIIADWKTSSAIDVGEYLMQLSAYAQAEYEETGKYVEGGLIVRVDKVTAKLETKEFTAAELKEAFVSFLSAKAVYDWHKKHETKWRKPK